LGRLYKDFLDADCEVLLILGDPIDKAKRYAETLHLPFPVLADPERNVYHLYGLDKAFLFVQRTASVVVDRNGTIQYLKVVVNPMTWLAESQELLQVVQNLAKME
jgi:peroxiredoxin